MNAFFGPYDSKPDGTWEKGQNTFFGGYRLWLKLSQVPNPVNYWVFIDEHPDSINDGYFLNNPGGATTWGDFPASYHNGACGLSFADGHSEIHKWRSGATKIPVRYLGPQLVNFDPAGLQDYKWLLDRTAVKY
jgi:prepilin-type processing-associated H-X9-DG protein